MSSILFIAVQCYKCSTMQVKQKKKNNNWTCVVCNQKQSVRKVFAQGYKAKDIRMVVQSFNMSRKFADDEIEQNETLTQVISESDAGVSDNQRRKRRSDWNEYLDPNEDGNKENVKEKGDEFGPKIVTELPKELFKKPKLNKYASGFDGGKPDENSYKPVFSKRNANRSVFSRGKEGKKHQPAKLTSPSKWCDFTTRDYHEPRTTQSQPTMGMKGSGSKWGSYITNDENNFKVRNGRNTADDIDQCSLDVWETMVNDDKVEDDVHTDFM